MENNILDEIYSNIWHHGIAGTEVFVNKDGKVEVNMLPIEKCQEYAEMKKQGIEIPFGVSISDEV